MSFIKGHNAFIDIPGFDASKGERIVKALQKLWQKIEYLEQTRISERKSRSELSRSSKDEDLTITDVQYKLLILQLQYARSILRKKVDKNYIDFPTEVIEGEQSAFVSDRYCGKRDELHNEFEDKLVSQKTKMASISVDGLDQLKESDILKNTRPFSQVSSIHNNFDKSKQPFENVASGAQKTISGSSKPHYHLKLDDVPFILGASASASHSVVANVQNIIAMMKSHNKALCGPKLIARPSALNVHPIQPAVEESQDATKMLNELSKDLYDLALKQQKLVKSIDAAQGKSEVLTKNILKQDRMNKKHVDYHHSKKRRSNSESEIKVHAEVKNLPKVKEREFIKYNASQKQNFSHARSQPNNLSIVDRRKLLRSLQDFKTHLSEEDISWD